MKKALSFILVAAMLLCMIPAFGIFAATVEIDTAEEFLAIENDLAGSYKLTADITLTDLVSLGEESKLFTGTLDGDGHTITLNVDGGNARTGLFCSASGCTVKNLTVKGKLASSGNSSGVIIGTVKGTDMVTIENVTVDVDVATNSDNGQGGLIGCVEDTGANVTIKNCTNKGDISGHKVGGLIGYLWEGTVVIENSVNEGTVTCTNQYADYRGAGGLIGVANNNGCNVTIKNCENKGNVVGTYVPANAYVGHNNANTFNAEGTKNSGKVISGGYQLPAATATAKVAGIWGGAAFSYDFDGDKLSGSTNFHALPALTGYKAYVNGVEATSKVTVAEVAGGNRQVDIAVNTKGLTLDGYASVTIVWSDGTYSTFGTPAPSAADAKIVKDTAAQLEKLTDKTTTVVTDSVKAENPFLKDGQAEPHGSEGNLFDESNTNKYEGWKPYGKSTTISFELTEAVKVGYYALGTGGDDASFPSRQPDAWKLWASVDGKDYVVIDEVTDGDLPNVNNKLVLFDAETDVAYKYFKLEIISIEGETNETEGYGYAQLGEIKIYKACDHDWETKTVAATCTKDGGTTDTCKNCGKQVVTVEKATGHDYNEEDVCTKCGAVKTVTPPPTGDAMVVAIVLVMVALAGVVIVSKKRRTV